MKPRLVLGLGNEMAGDDAIGLRVAERLRDHPRLPPDVEVRLAGSDLLRAGDSMRGRQHVILIDALLGDATRADEPPGTVLHFHDAGMAGKAGKAGLADYGASAHQLPPTAALALLRAADPALRDVPVSFVGVIVDEVRVEAALSPELAGKLDAIVGEVVDGIEGEGEG